MMFQYRDVDVQGRVVLLNEVVDKWRVVSSTPSFNRLILNTGYENDTAYL